MYNLNEIIEYVHTLFRTKDLNEYQNECGITFDSKEPVKVIAYCTNITPETVEKAHDVGADLLITHHDAWDFIYDMKETCLHKLKDYGISHFFSHLPLDDAPFGTNSSLLKVIGANEISKHAVYDGFACGALGEFDQPIQFSEMINKLQSKMKEPVLAWKNHDRAIKKVYTVCGGGSNTEFVKEAIDLDADVYITGEKVLYTLQYAKDQKINLVIGSHTFTEVFGVMSLVDLIKKQFPKVDIFLIEEDHIETNGFTKKIQ